MNTYEFAKTYLAQGFSVIPCRPREKIPMIPWVEFQDRKPTEDEIQKWWTKWPDANLAVITGKISGIFALDVDGQQGIESLSGKTMPVTPASKTGKGFHYLFKIPSDMEIHNSARKIAPGLDIRGEGGYFVAPPSIHSSGRVYEWTQWMKPGEIALSEPPGWLLDCLKSGQVDARDPFNMSAEISEGKRNDSIFRYAATLVSKGLREPEIMLLVKDRNNRLCRPPMNDQEVARICQSAIKTDARNHPDRQSVSISSPIYTEETETDSKTLITQSLAEIVSREDHKIDWIVDNIIAKETANIIAGPAGKGKSWMVLDLAIECARNDGHWLNKFQVASGTVLYLDEESNIALLTHRLKKLLREKKLEKADMPIHFAVGQGFYLDQPEYVTALKSLIEDKKPSLIIMDSLIRIHSADENSAKEMSKVFEVVKGIMRGYGVTFLFVDHARKPGNQAGSNEFSLRGSSDKVAFVDTLITLGKDKDQLIAEHAKSRYGEPVPSFIVKLEDPQEDRTRIYYGGEADEVKRANRIAEGKEFLEKVLSKNWQSRPDLVVRGKEAGVSEKAIDECLDDMFKAGRIDRDAIKLKPGPGGKPAVFRLKQANQSASIPSIYKGPETETDSKNDSNEDLGLGL